MDLARYREDPLDDAIGDVVREAASADLETWARLQDKLTAEDCSTLFAFADRRSALALRTGRDDFAAEAVEGLALIATRHVDPRDLTADFPLFALRETSGDIDGLLAFAIGRSQPEMRNQFKARAKTKLSKLSLHVCGRIEVSSRHGLGFMETWWRPAPRNVDLPTAAIAVADRIDDDGRYGVEDLTLSALPWVWFDPSQGEIIERRAGEIPTSGCVSISASLKGTPRLSHRFLVFLADFEDEAMARAVTDLARGASPKGDPRTAIRRGRRVLTVIGDWATARDGPAETQASLAPIAERLTDAAFGPRTILT
jgi:hypothetical protein